MRSKIAFLPSAKYMSVLSAAKSGFGIPAKPGESDRFTLRFVKS